MKPIIDISFWQDPDKINYDLLASQIDGVIIRAAYGTSKTRNLKRIIPSLGNETFLLERIITLWAMKVSVRKRRRFLTSSKARP